MRPVVATAADVEAQIYQHLESDAGLVALCGDRGGAPLFLYPTGDVGSLPRPFLHITLDGAGSLGPGRLDMATWAIRINGNLGEGTFVLNQLAIRVKRLFDRATWEWPTVSDEQPRRSEWAGKTGPVADEGYATDVLIARIRIYLS